MIIDVHENFDSQQKSDKVTYGTFALSDDNLKAVLKEFYQCPHTPEWHQTVKSTFQTEGTKPIQSGQRSSPSTDHVWGSWSPAYFATSTSTANNDTSTSNTMWNSAMKYADSIWTMWCA